MIKPLTITTTIESERGWVFIGDSFGDWRGVNEALGLRTRLKRSLTMVQGDVAIERLQVRAADGTWVDRIDRAWSH
jgi:hypothetical protein